jgi:hypothetical protein
MMNVIGQVLLLGNCNFFLELFLIANLISHKRKTRKLYFLRLALCLLAAIGLYWLPSLTVHGFGFSFLIIFIIVGAMMAFLFELSALELISVTFAAFAFQHITWNIFVLIAEACGDLSQPVAITLYLSCFGVLYGLYFLILHFLFREKLVSNWPICISAALIFTFSYVFSSLRNYDQSWTTVIRIYDTMCCFLSLCIHYGIGYLSALMIKKKNLEEENLLLENTLHLQAKQYQISKETIDIINLKCHDIKNQLSVISTLHGEEKQKEIEEAKKAINIYGSIAKTENDALNIILNEKGLLCESKHITLNYLVDPSGIAFMDTLDICSLFGNALDNAIEACEKEKEDQRIIRLNITTRNRFSLIHIENTSTQPISFKDGLPQTTKNNTDYHGFGTKSIRHVVEKYHGNCTMESQDGFFIVDILLPLPQPPKTV